MIGQNRQSAEHGDSVRTASETYVRLSTALRQGGFAGWDPYDALSAPLLRSIAGTPLLRRAAIQSVKRSPINIRPVVGVSRRRHTKGLALCVSAYARATAQSDPEVRSLTITLAEELLAASVKSGGGLGWGYDFDVQTRWGYYRKGTPNAVVTAFVAHALLDADKLVEDDRFRDGANQAAVYACAELAVDHADGTYFCYIPGSRVPIHNANLLVASLIARCGEPGSDAHEIARRAMSYSLSHQHTDGSWPYGEGRGLEWVDGFHTAYVLQDLDRWSNHVQEPAVDRALRRGLELYLTGLIDSDGAPRASLSSRYPIDIHGCATAISVLASLGRRDARARPTAVRVLNWTLEHMSRTDGQFKFQRHRCWTNSTPYFRWGNAHMLLALADLMAGAND